MSLDVSNPWVLRLAPIIFQGSLGGGAACTSNPVALVCSTSLILPERCSTTACTMWSGWCVLAGGLIRVSHAAIQLGSFVFVSAIVRSLVVILSRDFASGTPMKVHDLGWGYVASSVPMTDLPQ